MALARRWLPGSLGDKAALETANVPSNIGPGEIAILVLVVAFVGWRFFIRPDPPVPTPPKATWGAGVGPSPGQAGSVIPPESLPPVLTRTYKGRPNEVEILRAVDAEALARRGYYPSSQTYLEGTWSGLAWVLAFLALIFLIGIIILVYMIAAKPAGTLTVIYERRVPQPPPEAPAARASTQATTKGCPECAEIVQAAAHICRYCRYEFPSPPPTGS